MVSTWIYSSNQTGGLIEKRYANQDATGREKEDQFTGRAELAKEEIETFLKNPFFGVGVGKTAEMRQQRIGEFVSLLTMKLPEWLQSMVLWAF
jgi:hypothetical protein